MFIVVLGIFALAYAGINYYIGLRGWQGLFSYVPLLHNKAYWVVFWLLALSYLLGRLGQRYFPSVVSHWLILTGAYWLALMFYFTLTLVLVDIIRFVLNRLHILPDWNGLKWGITPVFGLIIFLFVTGLVVFGTWNAAHPRIQRYKLSIAKQAGNLQQLHLVMISDIHLGTIIGNGQLSGMVKTINSLNPDLIVFVGDTIDESVEPFVEQKMGNYFRQLRSKYGIYAVLGNHEYIGGHSEEAAKYLQEAGVNVLRDRYVKIADSFYVVGREDLAMERFAGRKRKPLTELLTGIDRSLPVILLDHQPSHLDEPEKQGIDLQLSGHTHRGQLFPIQLITHRIFEDDWGLLRKGNFQLIVSSGYGTWGPPIRVGNNPEIVDAVIHFAK